MAYPHSATQRAITLLGYEIYLNSKPLDNCLLDSFEQAIGIEPAVVKLRFPLINAWSNNFSENDLFTIYLNRKINPVPRFIGYIASYEAHKLEGLSITLYDLRKRLKDGKMSENFNERDDDGNLKRDTNGEVKEWGYREILENIWNAYLANSSGDAKKLQVSFSNIPNIRAQEIKVEGLSYGEALQEVLGSINNKAYFIYLNYYFPNECKLQIGDFDNPHGRADFYEGTDTTLEFDAQPIGMINAGEIIYNEDLFSTFNYLRAYGSNIIIETSIELAKGWDTEIETPVLENYTESTEEGAEEEENPEFEMQNKFVWSRFKIPVINDFGIRRQVPFFKNLISSHHLIYDEFGNQVKLPHFLVLEWEFTEGVQTYKPVLNGYKVEEDRYVIFDKPPFTITYDDDGNEIIQKPTAIYINFAYISRQKFYKDVNYSNITHKKTMVINNDSLDFWAEYNNFRIQQAEKGDAHTLQAVSGFSVVKNDITELTRQANDELKKYNTTRKAISIPLPRFDDHYKLAQGIYVNGNNTECLISSITYDCQSMHTSIMGMNLNE